MKFLLYGFLALVLVACVITLYGFTLPVERTGSAQKQCQAEPKTILTTLLDVGSQPSWRPAVKAVELSENGSVWIEATKRGEKIMFALQKADEQAISMTFTSDNGYEGKWNAQIFSTAPAISTISVTEQVTIKSPIGRIVSRLLFDPKEFSEIYLEELCKEAQRRTFSSMPNR
jgi:hypothetical protein